MGCPTLSPDVCNDTQSDWYKWTTNKKIQETGGQGADGKPFTFASPTPVTDGPGQWELYASDYALMKEKLGIKAYRLSIEWSRIFPKSTEGVEGYEALKKIANADAIAHYHKMFKELRKQGIEPYVTLNHYTLPLWIHSPIECHTDFANCKNRGWDDPKRIVPEIAKYAGFVAKEFGGEVDAWITLNEPFAVILPGYVLQTPDRVNPPAVSIQFKAARTVLFSMIDAHARMYDAIKKEDTVDASGDGKSTWIGIAYSFAPVYPTRPDRDNDKKAAENVWYLLNDVFIEAIVNGKLDAELDGKQVDRPDLKRLDWLGVNYYMKASVKGLDKSAIPDLSVLFTADPFSLSYTPQYPKGLYDLLMKVKDYNMPIVITENGHDMPVEDGKEPDDSKQPNYLVRHLFWLHKAIQDGADVKGYMYWSFVDNFEWNHGFKLRFGLFGYDPKSKARKARAAVDVYRKIIQNNALSKEMLTTYLTGDEQNMLQ
jgi:beta-glucosidase/6-phospho-beta-glucosidase/beta-galactosidase